MPVRLDESATRMQASEHGTKLGTNLSIDSGTAGFNRIADAALEFNQRYWRFVVVAMLVLLHVAALRGPADGWARALLLAHLGLLLIWQPFVRGQYQVTATQLALIGLGAATVTLWLNAWLLVFWVVVLAGLIGGKVFLHQARWQRRFYLLVLVYLIALLAVELLPGIAPSRGITEEARATAQYGLPALFLVMAMLPTERDAAEAPQAIDFFYSIFLMLLLGLVILGSFAFMTLGRTSYLEALTYTVFLIAAGVFLIGLAWNPYAGFAGLNVFFSRYVFSIGLPVEKWLYFLAELSQAESRPERFLAEGIAGLTRLTWVSGAAWQAAHDHGEHGEASEFAVDYDNSEVSLVIYSRYRTSPALHWHLRLLGQLLGEFYIAKLREQKLQQQSYLLAVHETGARLTHDVKNLLQSLNALCSAAEHNRGADSPELQALIRRQLPVIAQRLSATLDKLQRPRTDAEQIVAADVWWAALKAQYESRGVEFSGQRATEGLMLPRSLAESVADNLLQNALAKRQGDPAVRVRATLACDTRLEFRVIDSGMAVPPDIERQLMRAPLRSAGGLGIGLYQVARQAEASGYALKLEVNRDGEVCFAFTGPKGLPASGEVLEAGARAQGSTPAAIILP